MNESVHVCSSGMMKKALWHMTMHGCSLLDNAGAYCPYVPSALVRREHLSELKNTFVSSSEGFQREAGGSLPLGAVATATKHL